MPHRLDDAGYLAVLHARLPPLLDALAPDIVFYNAGVDPHRDDRLAPVQAQPRAREGPRAFLKEIGASSPPRGGSSQPAQFFQPALFLEAGHPPRGR